jgi:porin
VLGLVLVPAGLALADDARLPADPVVRANAGGRPGPSAQAPAAAAATAAPRRSKSGYVDPGEIEGAKGVGNQLVDDDTVKKKALIHRGFLREGFYKEKRKLKEKYGIELNADYSFLNQYASESETDRQAASGALRFYGRWIPSRSTERAAGKIVFRFENRHRIGPGITPRDLGFDAGSALSTASFKAFGWGVTSLYFEKGWWDGRLAFVAGQMDPGDFQDLHPLLNAWTAFMSDGSFNNPTVALPQQGLGVVGRAFFTDHIYLVAGLNDANGSPVRIDFESFFEAQEYHTWAELGWSPSPVAETAGESIHVTAWHSDPRVEAEVDEGWGVTFSAAYEFGKRWTPFVRVGYSNGGGGALLERLVSGGVGVRLRDDFLGTAVSWGRPPDGQGPDQVTTEVFYRILVTPNLQVTPGIHWTIQPSVSNTLWVGSVLRVRLVL